MWIKKGPVTAVFHRPCKQSASFIISYFHIHVLWTEIWIVFSISSLMTVTIAVPLAHLLLVLPEESKANCVPQGRVDHLEVSFSIYIKLQENKAGRAGGSFHRRGRMPLAIGSIDVNMFLLKASLIHRITSLICHKTLPVNCFPI